MGTRSSGGAGDRRERIAELARLFLRLGVTAFGGPAAHIALMHREVVTDRRWLTDQRFVDLIGVTNLIPGPNSTEMAMHIGRERAGWRGLMVAGLSFICPAALIVLALAWLYERYGTTPSGERLLFGIKPVMVVIVLQAVVRLGGVALRGRLVAAVAVLSAVAYLFRVHELLILAAAALAVLAARTPWKGLAMLVLPGQFAAAAPDAGAAGIGLWNVFLVFLKAGALLYGSGYVLLAFLQRDLVDRLGAMTGQQLLDAIAIGQVTPGPVFTTATFIGYSLGGLAGAALATFAIFAPGFAFVAAINPLAASIRNRPSTAALLDGVNAGALGLMAAVLWDLGRDGLDHWLAVAIAAVAAALLLRTKINATWVIAGGAIVGLLAGTAGILG